MFKIHLMCNDTPVLDGGDEGIRRRIRKIDYISSFKDSDQADPARHIYKRDTHAVNELKGNTVYRMEFLRLLFENFDLNDELKMPRSILKPTLQLFSRNDPIRTFMDLYVERGTGEDYLQLSTLKDLYKEQGSTNRTGFECVYIKKNIFYYISKKCFIIIKQKPLKLFKTFMKRLKKIIVKNEEFI